MCGIVGKIAWTGAQVPPELLERMAGCLRHRGPDEGGVWADGPVGLAMRRLRIIDLAGGRQPMSNAGCPKREASGLLRLVYNGEIYNFQGLRAELERAGHRFESSSDTEVVLHAFEEFGERAWDRLNGMFGLALYAERDKTLYLVRDRQGIKPVYYRAAPGSFSFASEIKALLADPDVSREPDPQALNEYFSLRYIPTPRSVFREVRKLEPGHYLKVAAGRVQKHSYWDFRPVPARITLREAMEGLDRLLFDAVRSHLVSDVPLGVFLSGGLDSTTVAYYVHRLGVSLDSFTVYFPSKSFSERDEAVLMAKQYGLRHHELEVKPKPEIIAEHLAEIFDEPFADASSIPTWHLSQLARQRVTVALSGDGGDELFAGYPTYIADRLSALYRRFPALVRRALPALAARLPVSFGRTTFDYRAKAFFASAERPQPSAHFGWQEMFTPAMKGKLFLPGFRESVRHFSAEESFVRAYSEAEARNELEKMLFVDQHTHLLDEYLVKMDRLSMAHSLEVRVPLLDRPLVEFAAALPPELKLKGWTTKWILRRLMWDRLPKRLVFGKKKGFSPPLAEWLAGDWRPWAESRLTPDRVRRTGILNPEEPLRLLREHGERKRDLHRQLWVLLSYMFWFEKYGN